jgi:pyrrolidone-carboxylate peptidase
MDSKQESVIERNHKHIGFYITGFGPFGNHKTNPTSTFVEAINKKRSEFENKQVLLNKCFFKKISKNKVYYS